MQVVFVFFYYRRDLSRRKRFARNNFYFHVFLGHGSFRDLRDTFLCLHVEIFSEKLFVADLKINVSIDFLLVSQGSFFHKKSQLKRNQVWWTLSDVNALHTQFIHSKLTHTIASRASLEKNFLVNKWFPVIFALLLEWELESQREIKLNSIKSANKLEVTSNNPGSFSSCQFARTLHMTRPWRMGKNEISLLIIYDQIRT